MIWEGFLEEVRSGVWRRKDSWSRGSSVSTDTAEERQRGPWWARVNTPVARERESGRKNRSHLCSSVSGEALKCGLRMLGSH